MPGCLSHCRVGRCGGTARSVKPQKCSELVPMVPQEYCPPGHPWHRIATLRRSACVANSPRSCRQSAASLLPSCRHLVANLPQNCRQPRCSPSPKTNRSENWRRFMAELMHDELSLGCSHDHPHSCSYTFLLALGRASWNARSRQPTLIIGHPRAMGQNNGTGFAGRARGDGRWPHRRGCRLHWCQWRA